MGAGSWEGGTPVSPSRHEEGEEWPREPPASWRGGCSPGLASGAGLEAELMAAEGTLGVSS